MFKAFTVSWNDIPKDVNRGALGGDCVGEDVKKYYDDYLIVQVDGKTIWCKLESQLDEGMKMITELMELAYYLGVISGISHEQGYMGGRSLKVLDEGKPDTKIPKFMKGEGK